MKIKRITPDSVAKMPFVTYKKSFREVLKKMRNAEFNKDNPTDCLIWVNNEYPDKAGKPMMKVIVGRHTAAWKKMAKKEFKDNKNNFFEGKCYMNAAETDGTQPLVVMRKRGKAKVNMMMRQAPKLARAIGSVFQLKMHEPTIDTIDDNTKKTVALNANYTIIPEAGSLTPAHVMNDWLKGSAEIKKNATGRLKSGVKGAEKAARDTQAYILKYKDQLVGIGQKYNVPPAVMAAVMSKESGGGKYLKTIASLNALANKRPDYLKSGRQLKYAKIMTPQKVLYILKATIKSKLPESYEQYKNYTLDDIPNLKNDRENVWGDWGFGYGIVQFDIQHHPIKVINFLNAKTPQLRNQMLIEHQGKLLGKEIAIAKSMHPKWTDAQILQAAMAAYNTGQDHKNMKTFDRAKLDVSTTGDDYSSDALARALYFADLKMFDGKAKAKQITASVGKGGKNLRVDTTVVQQLLIDKGYDLGKWGADGDAGGTTTKAIQAFQRKEMSQDKPSGLIKPNDATWKALYHGPEPIDTTKVEGFKPVELPLKLSEKVGKGSTNKAADVKLVQALLKAWGHDTVVNGDAKSSDLIKHISAFQKKHIKASWSPDGIIGPNGSTIKKLMEKYDVAKQLLNPKKVVEPITPKEPVKRIPIKPLKAKVGKVSKGNNLEDVKVIQQLLIDNGYKTVQITGKMDAITLKAIMDFQKKNIKETWSPDGVISPNKATWQKLNAKKVVEPTIPKKEDKPDGGKAPSGTTPATPPAVADDEPAKYIKIRPLLGLVGIKKTNKPEDVQIIQKLLIDNGYKNIETSGKPDKNTIAAIKNFQHTRGLGVDGMIGTRGETWKALIKKHLKREMTTRNQKGAQALKKIDPALFKKFEGKPILMDVRPKSQGSDSTGCKAACETILREYLVRSGKAKKEGFDLKTFDPGGSGSHKTNFSIFKEDKTKIKSIVNKKDGKHGADHTSIANNAMDMTEDPKLIQLAYEYINNYLDKGIPVVVGVDQVYNRALPGSGKSGAQSKEAGYNFDDTTDHYILLVGRGMENGVPYFAYINTGGGKISKDDRLYPRQKAGKIVWHDPTRKAGGGTYTLSSVSVFNGDVNNKANKGKKDDKKREMNLIEERNKLRADHFKKYQKILKVLGFYKKGIDGDFGTSSKAALATFQKKYGLTVNVKLDKYTRARLVEVYNEKKKASVA
ncbi:MAG: hypothetical protein GY810_18130 [Aureispira sp.]|nr:hypothetical protein [Aureispira sp.]